jgi:MoxR-like ATPase
LTIGGSTYPLPDPFFVLATQNPIEQEGTYTLPEAQLDRFIFRIELTYPSHEDEIALCKRVTTDYDYVTKPIMDAESLLKAQSIVRKVPVSDHVYQYAVLLARATRPEAGLMPESLRGMVQWGAGPRASIFLLLAAKARAILHKRYHATTTDVNAVALPVLRHRIIPTFNAEAAGIDTNQIIRTLAKHLKASLKKP